MNHPDGRVAAGEGPIGRWGRRAVVALVVFVPAGVAVAFLAVQVSSRPSFCGSCHYMAPYYQSWLTSTHKDVSCVDCHIPPGIASEARKKYEALAMVARYFTGTYSTKPWAEVDDQSCLRSGCHETRLLLGTEVFHGVLFDHRPHLTEMRREKRLRCTSCHSQIVQGSHITVTTGSCALCHFKDTHLNEGTARCTLCHQVPEKTITTGGLAFDHGEVKRLDMNCTACHEGVVRGDGAVARERCYACHNEPERLGRFGETPFLHRVHVTEHKVDCGLCHNEIIHQVPVREEAFATGCESCHGAAAGHSAVRDLYRGIGGKGVAPQPAAMYLAGVRCEACHSRPRGAHQGADEVSCMACHGPAYLTIYHSWQAGLGARERGVRTELEAATRRLAARDGGAATARLAEARENLALVTDGRGVHNPGYALALLLRCHEDVAAALRALGDTVPPRPWLEAPYEAECLRCHFGVEYLEGSAFDRPFAHAPHVVAARLRCTVCHGDMEAHGGLRLAATDCDGCHERIARPMRGVEAEECLGCHPAEIGRVSELARFPHETHVALGFDCTLCHTAVAERRHRGLVGAPGALPEIGHAFCGTCHGGDVPAADGTPPDGADCAKCHE
jgi:nitrate/TMAO reductase-like tetraheme cytochrome c subunit